ncbi:MAG: hypothetical protein NVS3B26_19950 [Mycobacteriales bacterium]
MSARATPGRGPGRLLRAGLVATVAVGAGSLAHSLGGGCLTSAPLLELWTVAAAASWVLAAMELTGPVLLGWLGLTQLLTHEVLHAACAHDGAPTRHGAAMTLAHLGGLGLAAAALRLGEAGLWARRRVARVMRHVVRSRAALGRDVAPPAWPRPLRAVSRQAGQLLVSVAMGGTGRRGPPVGVHIA